MFSRKPSPTPRGVPLGELEMALKPTTLKTSREGDTLLVRHESAVTRVEKASDATFNVRQNVCFVQPDKFRSGEVRTSPKYRLDSPPCFYSFFPDTLVHQQLRVERYT